MTTIERFFDRLPSALSWFSREHDMRLYCIVVMHYDRIHNKMETKIMRTNDNPQALANAIESAAQTLAKLIHRAEMPFPFNQGEKVIGGIITRQSLVAVGGMSEEMNSTFLAYVTNVYPDPLVGEEVGETHEEN